MHRSYNAASLCGLQDERTTRPAGGSQVWSSAGRMHAASLSSSVSVCAARLPSAVRVSSAVRARAVRLPSAVRVSSAAPVLGCARECGAPVLRVRMRAARLCSAVRARAARLPSAVRVSSARACPLLCACLLLRASDGLQRSPILQWQLSLPLFLFSLLPHYPDCCCCCCCCCSSSSRRRRRHRRRCCRCRCGLNSNCGPQC
jgi:hypothetical protein